MQKLEKNDLRQYVAPTSVRRQSDVMCRLGYIRRASEEQRIDRRVSVGKVLVKCSVLRL